MGNVNHYPCKKDLVTSRNTMPEGAKNDINVQEKTVNGLLLKLMTAHQFCYQNRQNYFHFWLSHIHLINHSDYSCVRPRISACIRSDSR
jgi:hypothetical protein